MVDQYKGIYGFTADGRYSHMTRNEEKVCFDEAALALNTFQVEMRRLEKENAELRREVERLQVIVASADDWAIQNMSDRTIPEWLVKARRFLGTD